MSKTREWLHVSIAIMALAGCESVNSRHIIGERINEDLSEQLNGTWVVGDGAVEFHQVAPGEVRAAGVEWNDETGKFEVIEVTLILSRLGVEDFINMVRLDDPGDTDDDVEGTWYQFLVYELGDDTLTIRGAETGPFATAVDEGTLAGRVDIKRDAEGEIQERHAWIEGDKKALDVFVQEGNLNELFGDPEVLRRLTEDDDS